MVSESFPAPSFASSIPEKCYSVHRSGSGQTVPALRPMDSTGTLSSLIGSKAGPRAATTTSVRPYLPFSYRRLPHLCTPDTALCVTRDALGSSAAAGLHPGLHGSSR